MTAYRVQGSTASIVPYKQTWIDNIVGVSHDGAPIVGAFKSCRLEFDAMTVGSMSQWLQFCNTGVSLVTLTILNQDATSFTAFSGCFMTVDSRPTFESAHSGPFSILVSRLLV